MAVRLKRVEGALFGDEDDPDLLSHGEKGGLVGLVREMRRSLQTAEASIKVIKRLAVLLVVLNAVKLVESAPLLIKELTALFK